MKVVETVSCFQVFDQDTYRDPGSGEHGGSAEDVGIPADCPGVY